ncbi:precorrin-3B synthase [Gordonia sp. X0973]|uniref:precorrin-3B synthase n=1 Tax=Gordonia sp. X0973 TaxID=2742602 RepID=UPI000F53FD12|nr:precorrin-3B synthase [Gordonia sp. X0973]QKT07358.1 precorrin-3B synthase [Gordonia sp. X0973]
MAPAQPRTGADRCPGVLSTHDALDGALARVRLPGGRISPEQLSAAAATASAHGDGFLELTSRGNLQLRGLRDPDAAADALLGVGLGSAGEADKVRNILASPLAGRIGGHGGVDDVVASLDAQLRAGSVTGLSGRFLFGIDDGRGDVVAHRPDVTAVWRADGAADLLVAGRVLGGLPRDDVVRSLLHVAVEFANAAGGAWRIDELAPPERAALFSVVEAVVGGAGTRAAESAPPTAAAGEDEHEPLVGWLPQDDGRVMLGAVVPGGRLPARTAEFFAAVQSPIIVTPWREILLADLTEGVAEAVLRVLAPMGVIFDAASPWVRISSCAGRPGCAKSHADVRADSADYAASNSPESREHWVGCSRGCGSPTTAHVRVEAQSDGTYRRIVMSGH